MLHDVTWGPVTIYSAKSTGTGDWYKLRSPLGRFGFTLSGGNSTSPITGKGTLQGTVSDSSAPASDEAFTLSTKGAVGYGAVVDKPARQVRWQATTAAVSTSSTSATLVVKVCGTL